MKFLRQEVDQKTGTVHDLYQRSWRGHRVKVIFSYEFSIEANWDSSESKPDHLECYDTMVKVVFLGHLGRASLCNSWIDPQTEGPRGTNYLFQVATELLDEALDELGVKLAAAGHLCKHSECLVQGVMSA